MTDIIVGRREPCPEGNVVMFADYDMQGNRFFRHIPSCDYSAVDYDCDHDNPPPPGCFACQGLIQNGDGDVSGDNGNLEVIESISAKHIYEKKNELFDSFVDKFFEIEPDGRIGFAFSYYSDFNHSSAAGTVRAPATKECAEDLKAAFHNRYPCTANQPYGAQFSSCDLFSQENAAYGLWGGYGPEGFNGGRIITAQAGFVTQTGCLSIAAQFLCPGFGSIILFTNGADVGAVHDRIANGHAIYTGGSGLTANPPATVVLADSWDAQDFFDESDRIKNNGAHIYVVGIPGLLGENHEAPSLSPSDKLWWQDCSSGCGPPNCNQDTGEICLDCRGVKNGSGADNFMGDPIYVSGHTIANEASAEGTGFAQFRAVAGTNQLIGQQLYGGKTPDQFVDTGACGLQFNAWASSEGINVIHTDEGYWKYYIGILDDVCRAMASNESEVIYEPNTLDYLALLIKAANPEPADSTTIFKV